MPWGAYIVFSPTCSKCFLSIGYLVRFFALFLPACAVFFLCFAALFLPLCPFFCEAKPIAAKGVVAVPRLQARRGLQGSNLCAGQRHARSLLLVPSFEMNLPGGERAVVDVEKLRDYCLNPAHPRGRHKARVFAATLRLQKEDAEWLKAQLLDAALQDSANKS